jgi:hypothetical protein
VLINLRNFLYVGFVNDIWLLEIGHIRSNEVFDYQVLIYLSVLTLKLPCQVLTVDFLDGTKPR